MLEPRLSIERGMAATTILRSATYSFGRGIGRQACCSSANARHPPDSILSSKNFLELVLGGLAVLYSHKLIRRWRHVAPSVDFVTTVTDKALVIRNVGCPEIGMRLPPAISFTS